MVSAERPLRLVWCWILVTDISSILDEEFRAIIELRDPGCTHQKRKQVKDSYDWKDCKIDPTNRLPLQVLVYRMEVLAPFCDYGILVSWR